ncbi:MAG TPA: DNA-binding protein [Oceanospirillaceae bacterium]|nr:DNA-binding protein [Oceanospirillaceae bacterium]
MKTVLETDTFKKQVDSIWSEEDRLGFIAYISANPDAGDVIPKADGARKIRWSVENTGKRGGARIIYFNLDADILCLVAIYKKVEKENMKPIEIKQVR